MFDQKAVIQFISFWAGISHTMETEENLVSTEPLGREHHSDVALETNGGMRWNSVDVLRSDVCYHSYKYIGHPCTCTRVVYISSLLSRFRYLHISFSEYLWFGYDNKQLFLTTWCL
jgi:hypothetical protein